MPESVEKITFQVAEGVKLPLRIVVAPGGVNRLFETRGPHECTAEEWKQLERRVVSIATTEERPGGEKVIVGRKTVRAVERIAAPAETKVRMFGRRKDEEAAPEPA